MKQTQGIMYKILYVTSEEISLLDIPRVLDEMGYEVYQANFGMHAQDFENAACKQIVSAIDKLQVQYVISYDFIQTIAQACMETGIPYISWVYDAPQAELYTHYALYPCNYIFAFDKMQVKRMREIGVQNIEYMPLVVHVNKVKMVTETIGKKMKSGYQHDISFIGRMYKLENEDALMSQIDENLRQQLYQNIDSCFMKWDKDTHLHGIMSEECVACFGERENHKVWEKYPYMTEQFYYEAALLSRMLAYRERVYILNTLAEKYDVTIYTDDKNTDQLSEKVKIRPGMAYDVLSHVYKRSKINLNMSLHCIETGVPQRVQDIMASGAFVLSNYQEELEELFVPGEEIVFYHNAQELEELVEYYLTHDEERERIALNGQKRVLQDYSYHDALKKVLQYVDEREKDREISYIAMQRQELRERADLLLSQGTEAAYKELYEILSDKIYETTIDKTTDLNVLYVLADIWHGEAQIGISCIFDDVESVQQAEQKYLKIKHGLWRIEQGLSREKCMEAVDTMRSQSVSKFFIAKMICSSLKEQEDTILKVAKLMAEFSLLEAVEMLTYGLLFWEDSSKLLIQKADYLIQLNLFEEALKVLQTIEEPTEEIKNLIEKLSAVLCMINK